jgi:excisionase family DNA binding protein
MIEHVSAGMCFADSQSSVATKPINARGMRRIHSLAEHPEPYVTTSDLAEYWMVSRKQIYKQIEAGTLKAIRLGPRLMRISTREAIEFEKVAKMAPPAEPDDSLENGRGAQPQAPPGGHAEAAGNRRHRTHNERVSAADPSGDPIGDRSPTVTPARQLPAAAKARAKRRR